jgi:hypothetical protein
MKFTNSTFLETWPEAGQKRENPASQSKMRKRDGKNHRPRLNRRSVSVFKRVKATPVPIGAACGIMDLGHVSKEKRNTFVPWV